MSHSKLLLDIPNPFSDGIVLDPWEFDPIRTPDVETIHSNVFDLAQRLLREDVRNNGQSSLLVAGTAGSGKTHLVARLSRLLAAGNPRGLMCYVSFNDTAPQFLWSHFRRAVATDLFRPDRLGRSGMDRLLALHLPGLFAGEPNPESGSLLEWISQRFASSSKANIRSRLKQELFEKVRLDREVRGVLCKLFDDDLGVARDARDWLLGEQLAENQLNKLGVTATELSDQVREHQARGVAISLLRLSSESLPIVVCFDQIEQLMHTLHDLTGYARFGQVITKLRHDLGKGFLFLSFIRTDQMPYLREAVGVADWARVAENHVNLSPLTWPQANQLILQRMNSVEALRRLRQGTGDEYWPLEKRRLQEIHHRLRLTCTPRDLLWECKKLFGTGKTSPPVDEYLLIKWKQSCQQLARRPAETRLLHALNGLPWLGELLGSRVTKFDNADLQEAVPDANLFLQTPEGAPTIFSACPRTAHLWRRLDRLFLQWKALPKKIKCQGLVIVCNEPLKQLPPGTQTRLTALIKLAGVSAVFPSPEGLSALEALHSLFLEAGKGDLVHEGMTIEAVRLHHWAEEMIVAPGHEMGILRALLDEFGIEVPASSAPNRRQKDYAFVGTN